MMDQLWTCLCSSGGEHGQEQWMPELQHLSEQEAVLQVIRFSEGTNSKLYNIWIVPFLVHKLTWSTLEMPPPPPGLVQASSWNFPPSISSTAAQMSFCTLRISASNCCRMLQSKPSCEQDVFEDASKTQDPLISNLVHNLFCIEENNYLLDPCSSRRRVCGADS